MTGADLKAAVAAFFNRSDLADVISQSADLAVLKLEREGFWFQVKSGAINTAASVGYVSYPADFLHFLYEGLKNAQGVPLSKQSLQLISYLQQSEGGEGEPVYYAQGDKIYLYPVPDQVYSLPCIYYCRLGFPADAESNAWTDYAYDLTYWTVIQDVWNYMRNTAEAAKAAEQKNKVLVNLRRISGLNTGVGRVQYHDF